jgi:hypothetical protein
MVGALAPAAILQKWSASACWALACRWLSGSSTASIPASPRARQRGSDEDREHLDHALTGIEQIDIAQGAAAGIEQ